MKKINLVNGIVKKALCGAIAVAVMAASALTQSVSVSAETLDQSHFNGVYLLKSAINPGSGIYADTDSGKAIMNTYQVNSATSWRIVYSTSKDAYQIKALRMKI